MRMPWGDLDSIAGSFLTGREFGLVGCLSFEERCRRVPERLHSAGHGRIHLVNVQDPEDAFPDRSSLLRERTLENEKRLVRAGVGFQRHDAALLSSEDSLLDLEQACSEAAASRNLVLDVTSMPKRFFCFLLRRFMASVHVDSLVATYTTPGPMGYSTGHLAEDPMSCEHLPGFPCPLPPEGRTLVVSVGYESLSLRSLIGIHKYQRSITKLIIPFPPDGLSSRRAWGTLLRLADTKADEVNYKNIEVVPAWDAEQVFEVLQRWEPDAGGLTLAPFGPKPHSIAMALFAMSTRAGMLYTQPKSYNPDYCRGIGRTWAYVLKWQGIPCHART